MRRPWSVELELGGLSLTPKTGGASASGFGMLELAVSYRFAPAMELSLALDGGSGDSGNLTTGGLYADFHYRFLAERAWNVFAMGGVGIASAAAKNADAASTTSRGSLRLGGGGEYRFGLLALDAELRFVTIAANRQVVSTDQGTTAYDLARYHANGLELLVGARVYF